MRRGDIEERLDAHFYNPKFQLMKRQLEKSPYKIVNSKEVVTSFTNGDHGGVSYTTSGVRYLRGQSVLEDGLSLEDEIFISEADHQKMIRAEVVEGDVLFTIAGSIGNACVVKGIDKANINQAIVKLSPKPAIDSDYLAAFLNSNYGKFQSERTANGGVQLNINFSEVRNLLIPLPPLETQRELVSQLNAARQVRQNLLNDADSLLASLDGFLLEELDLEAPENKRTLTFAVKMSQLQLEGAVNPERYAGLFLEKAIQGTSVERVAAIVESKVSPSREAPNELWDWIRIDDLPNKPLRVSEVRTLAGAEIDGSFFEVRENDILVARLGPTIQNAKFVLCPPLKRQTVASSEFLVLRCKGGWNPTVVLWMLRTSFFRRLIYSKGRGGTPSRYRVNKEDFAKLPFPNQPANQKEIADEIERRLIRVQELRSEAEATWDEAKARFEAALLG